MDKKKIKKIMKGFTLIELLIVIMIIGILASIVTVNSKSSVDKANKSSAMATASSVLPTLVACQDDGGFANSSAPIKNTFVCCTTATCGTAFSGYDTNKWPDIDKTGWQYNGTPTGNIAAGDYAYTLKLVKDTTKVITCNMAANACN